MSWYNQRGALDKIFKSNIGVLLIPIGKLAIIVEEEKQNEGNSESYQEENVGISIGVKNVSGLDSTIISTGVHAQSDSVDELPVLLFLFWNKYSEIHFVISCNVYYLIFEFVREVIFYPNDSIASYLQCI